MEHSPASRCAYVSTSPPILMFFMCTVKICRMSGGWVMQQLQEGYIVAHASVNQGPTDPILSQYAPASAPQCRACPP